MNTTAKIWLWCRGPRVSALAPWWGIDTPAGPRNGRGVVETRARERHEVLYTVDSAPLIVRGEAIAVALPTGLLIAPISNRQYGLLAYRQQRRRILCAS